MDALLRRLIGIPRENDSMPHTEMNSIDDMTDPENQETMASADITSSGKTNSFTEGNILGKLQSHFTRGLQP